MKSWVGAAVWVMLPSPHASGGGGGEGGTGKGGGLWTEAEVIQYRLYQEQQESISSSSSSSTSTTNPIRYQFDVKLTPSPHSALRDQPQDQQSQQQIHQIITQPIESEINKKSETEMFLEFELIKRRDGENSSRVNIQDMTSLTHLNEPEMIRCLEERYFSHRVYTSTGPILIAINPYQALDIYNETILNKYIDSENSKGEALEPHIFQISDNAYRRMLGDKFDLATRENQSILVNGESGAGKTESTKHCLHYLAVISSTIASRLGMDSQSGNIENQIIASNPITESFGNAKTSRNNNSSRFGKFIELGYNADGIIENGGIRTYLLENVRVNTHVEGERNFHIFYELAAHSPELLSEKGIRSLCDFNYTNATNSSRNSITNPLEREVDCENYNTLIAAMNTMGIDPVDQEMMEDLIISILHLGNLTFVTSDTPGEDAAVFSTESLSTHVPHICELLGISQEHLLLAIGRRSLTVGTVTTVKKLSVVEVMNAKDTFAKTLYSALFSWVLSCINESLNETKTHSNIVSTIGVLDIFGFEFFEKNSLEQLCINYTNEKLQDHFNTTIFKSELELYATEGIVIKFDGYPDNSRRIELLENSKIGIFALCNEKLKLRGHVSYQSYAQDLYSNCSQNQYFLASKQHRNHYQFLIKHYAGDVVYSAEYFVEKNRNELVLEFQECLRNSSLPFFSEDLIPYLDPEEASILKTSGGSGFAHIPSSPMRIQSKRFDQNGSPSKSPTRTTSRSTLLTPNKPKVSFLEQTTNPSSPGAGLLARSSTSIDGNVTPSQLLQRSSTSYLGSATRGPQRITATSPKLQSVKKKSTLLLSFTKQLQQLMDSIGSTRSHFIRCIKPNSTMSASSYNHSLVMSQLRCGGVLGAIQVFRAGFPNRFVFSTFVERYSIFGYIIGKNELTKDFYLLKRKAIENNLEVFYWKRTCAILVQLIPIVHIILDLLKIPEKGEDSGGNEKQTEEEDNGEKSLRRKKISLKELLQGSSKFVKEKMLAELTGNEKGSKKDQQQELNIGKKQIFLRASYYEYLENLLYRANSMVARIVQFNWRYKTHQYLKSLRLSSSEERIVHHLVHMFRSLQTSRVYTKAFFGQLILLQRRFRVYFLSRRFRLGRYVSTWISSHFRGWKARAAARARRHMMARMIQITWRGYYHRVRYRQEKVSIIKLQKWYRSMRLRMVEKREGERYLRGIKAIGKLQAMRRGQRVRMHYQSLLLEKIERRKALQLLFPNHFQAMLNPKTFDDFTQSFFDQKESLSVDRGTSPMLGAGGGNVEEEQTMTIVTPPVVLYQKESYESWTPGSSPSKDTHSPLHDEEGVELQSNSRITALESEILALKSQIHLLERELEAKSKNRFMCF